MPFAKRSTYALTVAISTALLSTYAAAESKPSSKEMAWDCNMTKDGGWDCTVNETVVEQVEAASQQQSPARPDNTATPAQTAERSPVEPVVSDSKQATTQAAAVRSVQSEPIRPAEQASAASQPPSPAQPRSQARQASADTWNCTANSAGEWVCNDATGNRPTTGSSQQAQVASSAPATATAPYTTDEVIGSEWQCDTSPSGDWDCRRINVHALATAPVRGQQGKATSTYISNNDYAHLDWVYYRNPELQQCAGRYLEPDFPKMGDEDQAEPPLHLEATRSSTILGGLTQLEGNVSMRQGYRRLRSSSAELDQVTSKARFEGNVQFREPGMLMLGDSAQVDTETSEAIFNNASFVLHEENLRGNADRILRLEDERIRLEQGQYTYCPPYSEAWMLDADSIVLNREEGYGEAEGTVLRVGGVPIMYVPYFTFPIDDRRRSGFLYPSMSYSKDNGLDLTVPYYFNIAPNMDDTLTARYISERGLMLENEFRYLNSWSENRLSTAYLPGDDAYGDDRWLLGLNHEGQFAERWRSYVDFTSVSDTEYFDDLSTNLEINRKDHLDQLGWVAYSGNDWSFRALVHDYQTISGTAPYQRMPQLSLQGNENLQENLNLSYKAEFTRFDRNIEDLTGFNRVTGDRFFAQPGLNYNFYAPWGFVTPKASLWLSQYSLENQVSGYDDSPNIAVPILSVDSGLYFDRDLINGGTHTLEPRLFALYVPEEDQTSVPDFDTSRLSFNYTSLFRENRFSGRDRIGDSQQISLGLTSRYITEEGFEKGSISVGQAYYMADREVQLSPTGAPETEGQSDIATLATWYLNPNLRTYLDTILDPSDYKINSSTFGMKYNGDLNHQVNFLYRFTDLTREQTDLSFIWPLNHQWTGMGRVLYDIRGNETEEASLGLEYESCCWKVSFAGRRWLDGSETDGSNKYDAGIFLQLTLKGLGSFGSGSGGFLDDIIGYEEREDQNDY
ncbi:LPS-assembly protein LptD [Neptuniibacter halophilus]|uniref:LPS-assembly protein LptD n=1 Tax=Neptuniibacter halophilus TaxID=651666 RepID=UPI002572EA80|nr:LPS assembly protein LptD [Neptuniibacter halophilus]